MSHLPERACIVCGQMFIPTTHANTMCSASCKRAKRKAIALTAMAANRKIAKAVGPVSKDSIYKDTGGFEH